MWLDCITLFFILCWRRIKSNGLFWWLLRAIQFKWNLSSACSCFLIFIWWIQIELHFLSTLLLKFQLTFGREHHKLYFFCTLRLKFLLSFRWKHVKLNFWNLLLLVRRIQIKLHFFCLNRRLHLLRTIHLKIYLLCFILLFWWIHI